MPELVKVKRPFPMRISLRAGQIIDVEDWRYAAAFIKKGNLVPLSDEEASDYLENATDEDLKKSRVVSVIHTESEPDITINEPEKDIDGKTEHVKDGKIENGEKNASNPVEKIGVDPKVATAEGDLISAPEASEKTANVPVKEKLDQVEAKAAVKAPSKPTVKPAAKPKAKK